MTDRAAQLTYYTMLSLFPALLAGVALLGVFGQADTADRFAQYLADQGADPSITDAVRSFIQTAVDGSASVGLALFLGIATSLYGASGAFGAAGRALNEVYEVPEGRGFIRKKATDIGATLVLILLAVATLLLIFLGGGVAGDLFGTIGLGSTAADVWNIARLPAAIACAAVAFGWLYYAAPNVHNRRFRWLTPGAVTAVVIWIVITLAFSFYVSNLGNYNASYGAFGTAVILLVWLWLTNVAMLFGAELNAVLRRGPAEPRVEPDPDPDEARGFAPVPVEEPAQT